MNRKNIVSLDGSYGEGGGQIVRTASALSAITGIPCRIFNIRKNRKNPGLRQQHLIGIRALANHCNARIVGDSLGSDEIFFNPGEIEPGTLNIQIPTAGSITLVLQTLLLPAFLSSDKTKINFRGGGTDTYFSPAMDYHRYVFLKILERMGLKADIEVIKRGFYPKGGAVVKVEVHPSKVNNWKCIDRGSLRRITITSGASVDLRKSRVAERQAKSAKEKLTVKSEFPIEERVKYHRSLSSGSYICIIADFENTIIGSDGLGRPGKRAELVGVEVARDFLKEFNSGACLDKYAADQIVPFASLAQGESEFTVSEIQKHTTTNIWVIKHFIDKKIVLNSNGTKTAIKIQQGG